MMYQTPATINYAELQHVADYRAVRKMLKSSGFSSLFFGTIATAMGAIGLAATPINAVLLLIGLLMLGIGIACLVRPSPQMFLADGVVFVLLGLWNIGITVLESAAGGHGNFAIIGVFQIMFAVWDFKRYRRYAHVSAMSPPQDLFAYVDNLGNTLRKGKPKMEPNLAMFTVDSYPRGIWKVRFENDMAFLTEMGTHEMLFAHKQYVDIQVKRRPKIGSMLSVEINVNGRLMKAKMPEESYQKYERWKLGAL